MGGDAPGGGADSRPSELPASYRNPWEALAEDLRAVVADARLRLREFWRRNGEGDLWHPAWWPRDLAPLFWPLVVGAAVALVLAVLSALLVLVLTLLPVGHASNPGGQPAAARQDSAATSRERARIRSAEEDASTAATGVAEASGADVSTSSAISAEDGSGRELSAADFSGDAVTSDDISPLPQSLAGPEDRSKPPIKTPTNRSDASDPASGTPANASSKPEALSGGGSTDQPTPVLDPLNQLLDRPEAAGLVEAALGEAETGTLTLQLTPAFDRLSDSDRRRRAELWQRWALELGYDHLDLRDRRAGLRGRDALVGDGMILFSPQLPT